MNRCQRCNWNVAEGKTLCDNRKACWHRAIAMTPNEKAKKANMSREAYHARRLRKLDYWEDNPYDKR